MTLTSFWRQRDFLMTSSILKVSIMTQMDINFCISLFYIFLRNVMAFDKELAILYGFLNSRISKNPTLLKTFFKNFCLILYQIHIILCKTAKYYVLNQTRSILLVPPKYTFWSFWSFSWSFSAFLMTSSFIRVT